MISRTDAQDILDAIQRRLSAAVADGGLPWELVQPRCMPRIVGPHGSIAHLVCPDGRSIGEFIERAPVDMALLLRIARLVAVAPCEAAEWGHGECPTGEIDSELCSTCLVRRKLQEAANARR